MRVIYMVACFAAAASCAPAGQRTGIVAEPKCCASEGHAVAGRHRVEGIRSRKFTHAELWTVLEPSLRALGLEVGEAGKSMQGRPIRTVTYGNGPVTVLLWSQMHGDESTATMSLADIIAWFASASPAAPELRERLASRLRIVMIPMLNPDGAELVQRENAIGIDVNRDARNLSTPEARTLKAVRDSVQPRFGFNLHDQNARTLTGSNGNQVAIALLAPAADEERSYGPTRTAARLVASVVAAVLLKEIPGRLARYNDAHEPRAFGDLMQQWGTSTVLIESGAMPDDPEKQKLRTLNVVAILSALDAMATGSWRAADVAAYEGIPSNSRSAVDLLVRGGSLVMPGGQTVRADLALNYEEAVARHDLRLRDVGDLRAQVALDTVDVTGLYLHPAASMLTQRGGASWMRFDTTARLTVRRGPQVTSDSVSTIGGFR